MRKFLLGAASAVTALTGFGTCDSAFAQPGARPGTGPAAASPLPGGSYQQSCVNAQASGGQLTADCRDIHSRILRSTLPYSACRGDISNQNGTLSCAGSVASGGQVVDNGGDRRGKSDNTAAAVAAGAVAGALLGGALAGGGNGDRPLPRRPMAIRATAIRATILTTPRAAGAMATVRASGWRFATAPTG